MIQRNRIRALAAISVVGMILSTAIGQPNRVDLRPNNGGHPDALLAERMVIQPPPPQIGDPPIASGSFVNYESPQVKPLAVSTDGTRLFAVNTPNNSLTILANVTGELTVQHDIPVGLDPVAVAIQPGTNDNIVCVANHISDNVSFVDVRARRVVGIVEVGDEPVNVLFNDTGSHAFVITQGNPPFSANAGVAVADLYHEGHVVVINTATREIEQVLPLDANTPRAAVFIRGKLYVAALYSGNNTSVVGVTPLLVASLFTETQPFFNASPLAPWPDPHDDPLFPDPNFPMPSPLVHRIVRDPGSPGAWSTILDMLSSAPGVPDPAMVQKLAEQINPDNPPLDTAEALIAETIFDAINTDDHDLFVIDASNPANGLQLQKIVSNIGTTLTGMSANPITGELLVANMEARNVVRLEPNLKGHIVEHEVVIVRDGPVPNIQKRNLHANVPAFNDTSATNFLAQARSLANPTDIVFNAQGTRAYVAALGPGRVGVLNTNPLEDGPFVAGLVDVGRQPRGLALFSPTNTLYVMNRTDLSISVVDVSSDQPRVTQTLSLFNPEPPEITSGRDFLYSTRFSRNFASSCAVCHIDGHLDHVAWDLGDPGGDIQTGPPNIPENPNNPYANNLHPIKGPMVTQSLRGLANHDPLHWRGDKPTFQDFNGAFANLLGGSELEPDEMNAYTDFIHTVNYPPNPFRHRDDSFKDLAAGPGTQLYLNRCNNCHQVSHDGALNLPEVIGDAGMVLAGPPLFAQLQLVTQLRGLHKKYNSDRLNGFGLVHDGREEREENNHPLETFLKEFFPNIGNNPTQSAQMIAFVTAFPSNSKPVVGFQRLLSHPTSNSDIADVNVMITQHMATPSHCDVVAKATIAGASKGWALTATDPAIIFTSDTNEPATLNDLLDLVASGTPLTFTAVPPGSGQRIGIDADEDGQLDGMDACPQKHHRGVTDFDCDDDVDLDDMGFLQACMTGPNVPIIEPLCHAADFDRDGDADLSDFGRFQRCLSGPNTPAMIGCGE